MTLFMAVSGMPVYAEKAPAPEVTEQKDDAQASAEGESVLGIKKLYAEEPSMLTTGTSFSGAIKTLAAGKSKTYSSADSLIKSVQWVNTLPSGSITTKDVSANQDGSYLAWWDAGTSTIKLYSESGDVVLNPDSSSMFRNCKSLTSLDVSNWDTGKVTNMNRMFSGCGSLTTLDVSKWDTSQVTNMGSMFYNCIRLTTIYIGSGWNTDKVTFSGYMFTDCSKLPNFDASAIDKTHANADPDTGYMSYKVADLKYLRDSSFVLSGTSDYGNFVNMVVSSDKNGRMSFKNLEKGTYTLTEVSPTDGYIKNSVKYTVTVTDSGVSVVPDNADYYYETADQKVLFNIRRCCSMNRTMHLQFRRLLRQTPQLELQVPNSCCLVFRITEQKSAKPKRPEAQGLRRSIAWKLGTTCLPRPKPRSIMHWIRFQEWCRLTSTESLRLTGSPKKEVPSYGQIFGMRMER